MHLKGRWIFEIVRVGFREPTEMAAREAQRKLQQGKNDEQGLKGGKEQKMRH
jgi:hypothetical protein